MSQATTEVPSTTSEPAPTPSELGEVSSVEDVRDAAVAAGYDCASWEQHNRVKAAAESGSCSDADVFSSYASVNDRDEIVSFIKSGTGGETLLVGPNWIINSDDSDDLADALGGVIVRAPTG